jgi:hypothetical protein
VFVPPKETAAIQPELVAGGQGPRSKTCVPPRTGVPFCCVAVLLVAERFTHMTVFDGFVNQIDSPTLAIAVFEEVELTDNCVPPVLGPDVVLYPLLQANGIPTPAMIYLLVRCLTRSLALGAP